MTNVAILEALLNAGISVAAVDYRLMQHAPLPAAYTDSRQALQFLRSKSDEWNIDKTRVGTFGDSAGAAISLWLVYHDEMADPDSPDPIARESTRLTAIASRSGQTIINADLWGEWIPGMEGPAAAVTDLTIASGNSLERASVLKEISALTHLTADDPPTFASYRMAPDEPIPTERAMGWQIHHVIFGIKLKEKTDELGLEAHLSYPGFEWPYPSVVEFFQEKLGNG